MFNFLKTKKQYSIKFPIKGEAIDLQKVPDEVFASKMVGDGAAIIPSEGIVYSPVDGEVIQLFPTRHAIGIRAENGLEILIHIGVDTVQLKGEGFTCFVEQNQMVKAGEKLIEFDLELITGKAKSAYTPVLLTNMDIVMDIEFNYINGTINDTIMGVSLK